MGMFLDATDLAPFATIDEVKADAMIEDAESMAVLAAPCLALGHEPGLEIARRSAVKAILRGAILRWNEAGTGAVSAQTAGPFGQTLDTRQTRKAMFWPSEIEQLQSICATGDQGKAFSIDTAPSGSSIHSPICALMFGAAYCSCGADIAGAALFEPDDVA